MSLIFVTTVAGLLYIAVFFAIRVFRWRRNLDNVLRPIVEAYGLQLIDSRPPLWLKTGPFSLVAGKVGSHQTEALGVPGEYWTYRIVRVRQAGQVQELWFRLYFEAFQLKEAEWRPSLPSKVAI